MSLVYSFLIALTATNVTPDHTALAHPSDPLTAAAHASALCDCAGPLTDYLAYHLLPANPESPPTINQSGGLDHITIMQLINDRWGNRYDLGGFEVSEINPDYLSRWHLWIEAVQTSHGISPSYLHTPNSQPATSKGAPHPASRDLGPVNTSIVLECGNCDDAFCDALRLAASAQQTIFDGRYRHNCSDGCGNPEDEMRTRLIDAIYEGGPGRTGGWTFKLLAREAEPELELVHAKLVPVWGEEILFDFSIFGAGIDGDINLLSVMRAYQIHILQPNGQWVYWQWDINQPRLSITPPFSPYPSCHEKYNPSSPPAPTPGPSYGTGVRPQPDPCGGNYVRPLP